MRPRIPFRSFSSSSIAFRHPQKPKDRYNYNETPFRFDGSDDTSAVAKLTRLTAEQLAHCREPPKGVKSLTRDFIHDALYNPNYGYFSQRAVIFNASKPFEFRGMRDAAAFDRIVAERYAATSFEENPEPGPGKQVWHTPVELFQVRVFSISTGIVG